MPEERIRFRNEAVEHSAGDPESVRQGVTFILASGYKLSIQCGSLNYFTRTSPHGAANAEVAVVGPDGEWATRAIVAGALGEELDDDVRGHTTAEEIAKIMAHLQGWTT